MTPSRPGLAPIPPQAYADGLSALRDLLRTHQPVVLTGAGMSTESGIPDYRGPDGRRRVTPMQHGEFVGSREARQRYWARSFIGWSRFAAAEPNAGHRALARMQAGGVVATIITQNVDGLHQRAGAVDVVELHGSLGEVVCLACGGRSDREVLQARMHDENPEFASRITGFAIDGSQVSSQIRPDGDIVLAEEAVADFALPVCLRCGADQLKPDVVFFGGSVPKDRVARCIDLVDGANALLVLGSSLQVMSGYRFVRQAARRSIPVAIITHGPTRGDEQATVRVDAPLGSTLVALAGGIARS